MNEWIKKIGSTIYAIMILNALRIWMHGLIRMIRQNPIAIRIYVVAFFFLIIHIYI